jgi:hypothetical protein
MTIGRLSTDADDLLELMADYRQLRNSHGDHRTFQVTVGRLHGHASDSLH